MLRYPLLTVAAVVLAGCRGRAVELKPETNAAFNHYVQLSEQRMQKDLQSESFLSLSIDGVPLQPRELLFDRLKRGEVLTQRLETLERGSRVSVPGGLIHHWRGVVFVPGANLNQTLALLQDYDRHSRIYAPRVLGSKLIQHNGDDFKFFLRLSETKIVTVVLDTEYDVHYLRLDSTKACSRSYSTKVAEVESPGLPGEHEKPSGGDSGFLWRLNSYWRFWEHDGGVYIQMEAVSLTRDIPDGIGWLIRPFVTSIPRESLVFTLSRTRSALGEIRPDEIQRSMDPVESGTGSRGYSQGGRLINGADSLGLLGIPKMDRETGDLRNRVRPLPHCWGRRALLESKQGLFRLIPHA
jgi:hypothetical protein